MPRIWQRPDGRWAMWDPARRERVYLGRDRTEALRRAAVVLERAVGEPGGDRPPGGGGRTPGRDSRGKFRTVRELAEEWVSWKVHQRARGRLADKTLRDYRWAARALTERFGEETAGGIEPSDWGRWKRDLELERLGVHRMNNLVVWTRGMFKWAWDEGRLESPMRFGAEWRQHVVRRGMGLEDGEGRGFSVQEARVLLGGAKGSVRAWVYLGLNCAYGNVDLCRLRIEGLDLDGGEIRPSRRPKTGATRYGPLWAETVVVLREEIGRREVGLVWRKRDGDSLTPAVVSQRFRRECARLGVREQVGFYGLRRTCRTLMERARDPMAADLVMGHTTPGMGAYYTQSVERERIRRVVETVREALFPHCPGSSGGSSGGTSTA